MRDDLLKLMKELREYGQKNNIPNVTDEVAKFLNMMLRIKKPQRILEIGCANGYSTIWIAEAARFIGAEVHTVDHSAPTFEEAKKNVKKAGFSDVVHFHFGDAIEVVEGFGAGIKFDFVFVDGEKASYLDFWKAIEGRLEPGALVVFDDMMAFPKKTGPFYDFIQSAEGVEQLLIPIDGDDGILLAIKL